MAWREFAGYITIVREDNQGERKGPNVDNPAEDDPRFGRPPDRPTLKLVPWHGAGPDPLAE